MADAAVDFLLSNLKQLLLYHGHLISNANTEVVKLEEDLRLFQAFLKGITKKQRKDGKIKEIVCQIRDVVYQAEDIIDTFVTVAAESKAMNYFQKLYKKPANLLSIAKEVESLRYSINRIRGGKSALDFALTTNIPDDDSKLKIEAPIPRRENIVGFEDEASKLIGYLREETEQLDVISIIGMPGLGKTTLAGMIFNNQDIQYEFPTRIWVFISQDFTRKSIFLSILKALITKVPDIMFDKDEQELAQEVSNRLQDKKFLLVMDDMWEPEDWELLKTCLLMSNKKGKVIITSRNMGVGNSASQCRTPHELRFLTQEESWLLFQLEVFGKPECPEALEVYGKLIVDECDRLPLAIVVIGGILRRKVSTSGDVSAMETAWKKVSENVTKHISAEDKTKRMETIIGLSYDRLPFHLRACFLYLGMFPEDFVIPARKLTRMWIAEGLVQQDDGFSLEDIAESYLDDLINSNLLRVDKRTRDGKVKTCHIHDTIRDFCKTEAGKDRENFLQEIKKSPETSFESQVADILKYRFRRLCMHSDLTNFFSAKPYGPHVRSFVHFSEEEINSEIISDIPAAFKLLRVLELKPIVFSKYPRDMFQLVHLRYIVISLTKLSEIPPIFSKLWNLQTLLVYTKSRSLAVKADIWNMKQLRHFKTNASATLPKPAKGSSECDNIKTLGTISPQSCTEVVFSKARYVKDLGIRGRLAMLLDAKNGSFVSLGKLSNLEKLKLINDAFPHSASGNQLPGLPSAYQFPPKLRSLTLVDTFLEWNKMSTLGQLENLKVLKLKEKAFMGPVWEAVDGGFRKLEVLYIANTNLVIWKASEHHFPRLRSLELKYCKELQQVPIKLAEVQTFQILDLQFSEKAAASARKISQRKAEIQSSQTTKMNEFMLSIHPREK